MFPPLDLKAIKHFRSSYYVAYKTVGLSSPDDLKVKCISYKHFFWNGNSRIHINSNMIKAVLAPYLLQISYSPLVKMKKFILYFDGFDIHITT